MLRLWAARAGGHGLRYRQEITAALSLRWGRVISCCSLSAIDDGGHHERSSNNGGSYIHTRNEVPQHSSATLD